MPTHSRRDFIKFLALTVAGASALRQQIEAFERYYEANTPEIESGLVSVDEILLSGQAQRSLPVVLRIANPPLNFGVNLFGGILRWQAAPDAKIITAAKDFSWQIDGDLREFDMLDELHGHFSYVDQDLKRHYQPMTRSGSLA